MNTEPEYEQLNRLSILMAVDEACLIACLAYCCVMLLSAATRSEWLISGGTWGGGVYIKWTLELVRLISWSAILLTLPPLGKKSRSFDRARLWFLVRMFTFAAVMLSGLAAEKLDWQNVDAWSRGTRLAMLLYFVLGILMEALPTALGSQNILLAAGELLESMGRSAEAEKNRRCGAWFVRLAVALTLLLGVYALLAQKTMGLLLVVGTAQEASFAAAASLALFVLAGIVYLALWFASIRRVRSASRTAKELTN